MKYLNLVLVILTLFMSCKNGVDTNQKIDLSKNTIVLNPFRVAPLTAIVQVEANVETVTKVKEIYVKVLGKDNESGQAGIDISGKLYPQSEDFKKHFFDITKDKVFNNKVITSKDNIEIPVLGLYPNYENKVFIALKVGKTIYSDTVKIQTDSIIPDDSLSIDITECHPKLMAKGDVTWITADSYNYDFMFDRQGKIRWIINVEGNSDLRILKNGNLLIRTWWAESDFGEYTMLGESVNRWKLPDEFRNHHDIVEMPNGNFLVPVTYTMKRPEGYITVQDNLIELDRNSGKIVNNWDLFELMHIADLKEVWQEKKLWYKNHFVKDGPKDWFHMNSIAYDGLRDEIIVSGKHGGVIKLSRNGENGPGVNANKKIIWYMPMQGQYSYYANHSATKDYILTAVDTSGNLYADQTIRHDNFHWMKYQHDPTIIYSKGHFIKYLIFNNVYEKGRSAMVEYLVNEKNATVKEVWQYGRKRKKLYSAAWAGAVLLPKTNNRLMITAFQVNPKVEVTKNKKVAFEFSIFSKNFQPKWYRGGRINLYPHSKVKSPRFIYLIIIISMLLIMGLFYGFRKILNL